MTGGRGDGLRNSLTIGAATKTFTWDVNVGPPVILDDGAQYVYGAGLEAMKRSGAWYYYLADGLGSTMAIVDATGAVQNSYTYDIYGKPIKTGTLANDFDFAGQQTDATGLQYLRARYMDPETGTFLRRDPLAVSPSWTESSFDYAALNPASDVDPTGLCVKGLGAVCKAGSGTKNAAGSVGAAVAHPLRGDPLNNLLTAVQVLDTLPIGAVCVGISVVSVPAAGACATIDTAIGLAALLASMIQASQNTCSASRNGAYIGLAVVNGVADLYNPAGRRGGRLLKEGIESIIDSSALTGQTAITANCSQTRVVSGEKAP